MKLPPKQRVSFRQRISVLIINPQCRSIAGLKGTTRTRETTTFRTHNSLPTQPYLFLRCSRFASMIPLRQTRLGFTATKSLTIVKHGLSYEGSTSGQGKSTTQTIRLPPYVPTGESFVFRLPDELLLSIVELAICGPGSRSQAECE